MSSYSEGQVAILPLPGPGAVSSARTCSGVAPFCGANTSAAPPGPQKGVSTSQAASTNQLFEAYLNLQQILPDVDFQGECN